MASVVRFIERQLRLTVNQAKSAVAQPEERHFVGFSLRRNPEDGSVEVFLSKRSKARIDTRIRELTPRAWGQSLRGCIAALNTYLRGWLNFFGTSCTDAVVRTLHTLDAHVRRRLRAVLLRQWKRRRFIARRLIRMRLRKSSRMTGRVRRRQSARSSRLAVEDVWRVMGAIGCVRSAWCTPPVGPSLLGAAVEVRATVVAHGRAGRLLKPHPRGLGVEEGGPCGDVPARRQRAISAPWPGGGWRPGRGRIVRPARACAD